MSGSTNNKERFSVSFVNLRKRTLRAPSVVRSYIRTWWYQTSWSSWFWYNVSAFSESEFYLIWRVDPRHKPVLAFVVQIIRHTDWRNDWNALKHDFCRILSKQPTFPHSLVIRAIGASAYTNAYPMMQSSWFWKSYNIQREIGRHKNDGRTARSFSIWRYDFL